MAAIKPTILVDYKVNLELTEQEAKALIGLAGYDFKAFKKIFYEGLGQAYLAPYEKGLETLFQKIMSTVPSQVKIVENARKVIAASLNEL